MQGSFDPLLLSLAVHREHASYRPLVESGAFAVSVLREDQMALAAHFGQPQGADKLASIACRVGRTGARSWSMRARTSIARIDGAILSPDAAPLDYASAGGLDGSERLFPDTL
jgi:flavin reductase (DIM6/NTAB) family NADH-FMN oxidoreductase RutF